MAANQVLSVPELLEGILADLPMRSLLLMQRTSRQWNEAITHSPVLQQKLFFQPARTCPQPQENLAVDVNPLIQELFPPFIDDLKTLNYGNLDDVEDDLCLVESRPPYKGGVEILRQQQWYKSETKRKAVLRPDASWRRMFLSHPPPRLGMFEINLSGCGCGDDMLEAELVDQQSPGPRMGLIWDSVAFVLDDLPGSGFAISWWRRRPGDTADDEEPRRHWVLELLVETQHTWECFKADEAYVPSGLRVADYGNLIAYKRVDRDERSLTEGEAVPLSMLMRAQNEQ